MMPKRENRSLDIKGSRVLEEILEANAEFIFSEGGTSSTKTYSFCQALIIKSFQETGKLTTIVRKTWPSLRDSAYKDFFDILQNMGLYDERNFSKTEKTYELNGNIVQFLALDQPQKKRGARRDRLWMNEANEFEYEDYFQLMIRTKGEKWLDYNPSDEYHWIYEEIDAQKGEEFDRDLFGRKVHFIRSTFLDNPFLDISIVRQIKMLKKTDPTYWKIYGLGERAVTQLKIYHNWHEIGYFPEDCEEQCFGMDFGFNNPAVLLRVGFKYKVNGQYLDVYYDEIFYKTQCTNSQLIQLAKTMIPNHLLDKIIYQDSAEPDRIQEFKNAGFRVKPAYKGPNSVADGIDQLKRCNIYITSRSVNTIKEIKAYKWKEDKNGKALEEPLKFMDHAMDAMRYPVYRGKKQRVIARQL